MVEEPRVYIGICTYNRAKSLKRTLKSVIKIDNKNYQVIVIDNNSYDETKNTKRNN